MMMTRRTGRCLVPLLVIAALAVIPAGAQAAPRWLQNGSEAKLENGKLLPILAWGTLTLETTKFGLVKCRHALGGVATDPGPSGAGDLPGEAKVQGWVAYSCSDLSCELAAEPTEMAPLGQAANPVTKTRETVGRITTPWEAVLNEPKEKEWKLKIGNKTAGSETKIRFSLSCAAQAVREEFTGELNPLGENGQLIGAAPAKLEFKGKESGELEGVEPVNFSGKLKLMGYESQEVITVENR